MDTSEPRERGRAGQALVTLAIVLALLAVVAVASRGDATFDADGDVRRPSHAAIDTLLSLYLVVMGIGAVAFLALMILHKDSRLERRRQWQQNRRRNLLALALLIGALALGLRLAEGRLGEPETPPVAPTTEAPTGMPADDLADAYDPEFALLPVLVVGALAIAAAAVFLLAERARRRALPALHEPGLAETLADVLDDSLDDLHAERDPRRAVVAAYARLERALAAYGLARRPAEAPAEYVLRILAGLDVSPGSIRRLTALFEWAKFSQHDVDASMKEQAIEALQIAREELRAAHERELAAAELALAEARERAAG